MEHQTRALVLRSFDHGESDRVVHLYTDALGRVSAMAKGARRSRRRFPGALELLTLAEIRVRSSGRSSLLWLESARAIESYHGLEAPLERFAIACQLTEILDRYTMDGDPNAKLFRFAVGALGVLREEPPDLLLSLLVTAKTVAWLGYEPRLEKCAACGRALPATGEVGLDLRQGGALCSRCRELEAHPGVDARWLHALATGIRTPLRARHQLGLSPEGVRWSRRMLEQFFRFHVGMDLRSARFLRELDLFASPA